MRRYAVKGIVLLFVAAAFFAQAQVEISEGFEGKLPDLHRYQASYTSDVSRAHSGARSLRVTPTKDSGGAYFRLDGRLDFSSGYEYTLWVNASKDNAANVYISASDGKRRYTVSNVRGGVAGKWVQLRGVVRANQWQSADREFMLALSASGDCWFDDVTLRKADIPDPPIDVWPQLEAQLRMAADQCAVTLRRGQRLTLKAAQGAFAPAIGYAKVLPVTAPAIVIPAEGLLMFAVDVEEPVYVEGTVELEPDADLRPGLRAYVLADDTLIGAPMVKAATWSNIDNRLTQPAPDIQGEKPARVVKLTEWRLEKGRHYLTVAGAHMRPAGVFHALELRSAERSVEPPLYTFALFADTHLGAGRPEWMNIKMDEPAIEELGKSLRQLREEGVAFAFIAGDMTDGGRRPQIESLAQSIRSGGLPVYGCIGNHEAFTADARAILHEVIPELFPGNQTQYMLNKPPLRFLVLDGAWWRDQDDNVLDVYDRAKVTRMAAKPSEVDWLRRMLAEDIRTPTLVMWHFPFYNRGGASSCGYQLGKPKIWDPEVLELLGAAPNVVATLNGHMHFTSVDMHNNIVCLQNASYAEWPHLYRVLRVYPDRIEWEMRQVHNRGFVSEGALPAKALTWMISTCEGDLGGTVRLSPLEKKIF
ncbi:MAG: metallophosphoesterase [Kiritimatiellae bacterium]|nr:metallophosphoesterase [Kiritimatiellia bacterium]